MEYALPAAYEIHNYFRALDWRWCRANYLAALTRRNSTRRDDPETIEILHYVKGRRNRDPKSSPGRVTARWAAHAEAQRIFAGEGIPRNELEAHILCGSSDDEIAKRFGVTAESVHWYEAMYFNVRDRLGCRDWISLRVIGPLSTGIKESDNAGVLKCFAYFGGSLALDIASAVIHSRPFPPTIAAWYKDDRDYQESRVRLNTFLLIRTLQARSNAECQKLVQIYRQAAQIDNKQVVTAPTMNDDLGLLAEAIGFDASGSAKTKAAPASSVPKKVLATLRPSGEKLSVAMKILSLV